MKYKVNISIDDVSPHPLSSVKVLDNCYKLIENFEDLKFTLFVPIAYWRTIGHTATPNPLEISHYPEFVEALSQLPEENFEIAYHGLLHGIPGVTNNDEFHHLSYEHAMETFAVMFQIVQECGLDTIFKPYMRPPAWKMSPEAIRAARDSGITLLALSPKDQAKQIYAGVDELCDDVVYYNVNPPFDPLALYEKTEMVYHACEWDRNYLDVTKTEDLANFLVKNEEKIDFCFMEEMINGTI